MATNHLKRDHYDNAIMLSPDGKPMTTISLDKVDWYLSRDLARRVEYSGYAQAIQLKFVPKGNDNDPTDLISMPNVCVVCGTDRELSLHHCVPYCVKRHYPIADKQHTRRQCVLLCEEHHLAIEEINRQLTPNLYASVEPHLTWLNRLVGRYTQFIKKWAVRYWRWKKGGVKAINAQYISLFKESMKPRYLPEDWLQP